MLASSTHSVTWSCRSPASSKPRSQSAPMARLRCWAGAENNERTDLTSRKLGREPSKSHLRKRVCLEPATRSTEHPCRVAFRTACSDEMANDQRWYGAVGCSALGWGLRDCTHAKPAVSEILDFCLSAKKQHSSAWPGTGCIGCATAAAPQHISSLP